MSRYTSRDYQTDGACIYYPLGSIQFVVVSDRDDYLAAARDLGMFTCRVRPKNKRRGLTTNYNVDDIGSVLEVINDINGVSFNSALKG